MVRFAWKTVGDDDRFRPGVEMRLDVVEAQDAADLRDVERAAAHRHAVRHPQARGERDDLRGLRVPVAHRVHAAVGARADEEHLALSQRQRARIRNLVGEDADLEARRQLDALERQALGGRGLRQSDCKAGETCLQRRS